jgi:hypothetical protein
MVPLEIAAAVLVGVGVFVGQHFETATVPDRVTVRVIDDGAAGTEGRFGSGRTAAVSPVG